MRLRNWVTVVVAALVVAAAVPGRAVESLPADAHWLAPRDEDRRAAAARAASDLAAGIRAFHTGQFAQARARLAVLPASAPAAAYGQYFAGLAALRTGDVAQARRLLAAVVAGQPAGHLGEAAGLAVAEAAETAGDWPGAVRAYEQLVARPLSAPDLAWLRLARARATAGDRARAAEAYRTVYERYSLSPHAPTAAAALHQIDPLTAASPRLGAELAWADRLFDAQRTTDACAAYARLRPVAPAAARERLSVRRAACEYALKRYGAARAAAAPFLGRGSHQAEARYYDAMAARGANLDAEFVRAVGELATRFPQSPLTESALDALATHHIRRSRDEEADAAFRRLLTAFPQGRLGDRAAWKVGWRAYRAGRAAEAAQVFEQAAAAFPRSDYRPAFLYWAGRAHARAGKRDAAAARHAQVRAEYRHSHYGHLVAGAAAGGQPPADVGPTAPSLGPVAVQAPGALPPTADVIRLLLSLGLWDEAGHELRFARRVYGDSALLQATEGWLQFQRGDLRAGSLAMKRAYPHYIAEAGVALPPEVSAVIYPVAYWNLLQHYASNHKVDPHLVGALVLQESSFVPDILSRAKAAGLMQLMPATAARYAKKLGLPFAPSHVTRPETNVRIGVAYLADLLRQFGEPHLALASYNAGESRVRRWMAERPGLAADEFIDDIPFPETQNYVKKVLGVAENYRRIYARPAAWPADLDRGIPHVKTLRLAAASAAPPAAAPVAAKPTPADAPAKKAVKKTTAPRSGTAPAKKTPPRAAPRR